MAGVKIGRLSFNTFNLLVVFFVGLSTFALAYGLSVIGSTAGQPNFYTYFNLARQGEPGYAHTTNILGALNGSNSAGAFFGCFIGAYMADRFSRKRTMLLGCAILVIGGGLNGGSVTIPMFAVGRLVAGVGSGVLAVVVPMYQGEVATAETRGAMVSVTGIMFGVGYTTSSWIGYGCAQLPGTSPHAQVAWRFPLTFQCLAPLVVLAGSRFIPYSPRWLLSQGRHAEALDVLKRLHGTGDSDDLVAREEFYLISKQYEADKQLTFARNALFEMFRTKANRRRAAIAALLMVFNQFIGTYVLGTYGVIIYANLGFKGTMPLLLTSAWTTMTIFGNSATAYYIDRIGRRPLLLIGTAGCLVCLVFEAALTATYVDTHTGYKPGLDAGIFFIWLLLFFWAFFMDATQFVYVSEIWPNHLRSWGTAWGLGLWFLGSEVTLVAAPVALNSIGWRFYLVLICPTTVYLPIIYFFFPETKGRTLEEMGAVFGDEHVAAQWYGISDEEKARIAKEAMNVTSDGHILELEGGSIEPSKKVDKEGVAAQQLEMVERSQDITQ